MRLAGLDPAKLLLRDERRILSCVRAILCAWRAQQFEIVRTAATSVWPGHMAALLQHAKMVARLHAASSHSRSWWLNKVGEWLESCDSCCSTSGHSRLEPVLAL